MVILPLASGIYYELQCSIYSALTCMSISATLYNTEFYNSTALQFKFATDFK